MPEKLHSNILGEQTAENDKLLIENYVETPEYRSILETRDSTVIVGRRGTGKSAMRIKLDQFWSSLKDNQVITISPEDYETIGFRGLFKRFESKYAHTRAAAKIVWKYGLLLEVIAKLSRCYKVKAQFSDFETANTHLKKWNQINGSFFSRLIISVAPFIKSAEDDELLIGLLNNNLEIADLENDLKALLQLSPSKFFILVDRLDEGYENDEAGAAIISGVIGLVSEINKKYEKIRPILFQRDNILRSVARFDPDYTRNIESEIIRIHWDTYQLLNLVAKRLNKAFNLEIEKNQRIWDRCTADEGADRELTGQSGFKKCLQFTLYRPRDLLSLLNQSFYLAAKENREVIVLTDIEKTAKNISETRLEDLKKEYSSILPSLGLAINVFANGNPELSYSNAISLLDSIGALISSDSINANIKTDYAILQSDGLLRALYSIGFLGIHDDLSNSYNFCHDGRSPDREFTQDDKILIHPCY